MTLPTDFDEAEFQYGVKAGGNKFGMRHCPFCHSEGDVALKEGDERGLVGPWFLFRDNLSAKEYTISGLCQKCQDKTFVDPSE